MTAYSQTVLSSVLAGCMGAAVAIAAPGSVPAAVVACGLSGAALVMGVFDTLTMNLAAIRAAKADDPFAEFTGWAVAYAATVAMASAAVAGVWWFAIAGVLS